jgi:putative ABC transport system substrate-binding protein
MIVNSSTKRNQKGTWSSSPSPARRDLILAAAAWPALAWSGAAFAQPKQQPVLIGWLHFSRREEGARLLAGVKEGLAALGWKEGVNYVLEERWADGRAERLRPLAEELAARKPALIIGAPSVAVAAAAKAAPTTPIVIADGDPLNAGLVTSLSRPGGMITGVSNVVSEIQQKFFELLLAVAPDVRRIGALVSSPRVLARRTEEARRAVKHPVEVHFEVAATPADIEPAMSRLAKKGVQALIVFSSPLLHAERQRILKLALAQRWPVIAPSAWWVERGALLSYSADILARFHRIANYIDRILKGAKPGDLPIEQPTKFELTVNMKTARALGLTIPPSILVQATRVIE